VLPEAADLATGAVSTVMPCKVLLSVQVNTSSVKRPNLLLSKWCWWCWGDMLLWMLPPLLAVLAVAKATHALDAAAAAMTAALLLLLLLLLLCPPLWCFRYLLGVQILGRTSPHT